MSWQFGQCSPLVPTIVINLPNSNAADTELTVFNGSRIGKWQDLTTIEEYSRMISLMSLSRKKLRNSSNEGSQRLKCRYRECFLVLGYEIFAWQGHRFSPVVPDYFSQGS